jgi:hypothetical protein
MKYISFGKGKQYKFILLGRGISIEDVHVTKSILKMIKLALHVR